MYIHSTSQFFFHFNKIYTKRCSEHYTSPWRCYGTLSTHITHKMHIGVNSIDGKRIVWYIREASEGTGSGPWRHRGFSIPYYQKGTWLCLIYVVYYLCWLCIWIYKHKPYRINGLRAKIVLDKSCWLWYDIYIMKRETSGTGCPPLGHMALLVSP